MSRPSPEEVENLLQDTFDRAWDYELEDGSMDYLSLATDLARAQSQPENGLRELAEELLETLEEMVADFWMDTRPGPFRQSWKERHPNHPIIRAERLIEQARDPFA